MIDMHYGMPQNQFMPNPYNMKMQNLFEYGDPNDMKTRTSTFSKVSESREEINKQMFSY
jgi:hypothetical protein